MKINIKEFFKKRLQKESGEKSKILIENILRDFEKKGVRYCILRNYDKLGREKDVDLLVEKNVKINDIMNKYGLKLRYSYGYFMSYKGNGLWFDFKVDALSYHGIKYKNFSETKVKNHKHVYILKEEDELIHIILHCIMHKGVFYVQYKEKIKELLKIANCEVVVNELISKFPKNGKYLFDLVKSSRYDEAILLRNKLLKELFKFKDILTFLCVKSVFLYGKTLKKIVKLNN
jgi:hypothetical protein